MGASNMNSVEYIDVYRIEKNGRGPYNKSAGYSMYWNLPSPDKDADLPLMKDEDVWKYRFGSPSAESLIEWIKDAFKLSELGYKVSLYKAKKKYTHSSEIQTMFIKRHAKKVKEWSVEEFCKGNI
jgi:hypothetical protein